MTVLTKSRLVDRARAFRDLTLKEAAESERLRTLSAPIVAELRSCGLLWAMNPLVGGGAEPTLPEMIETWVEMSWQDASFGWVGLSNMVSTFTAATYLPDEGFTEIFTVNDCQVTIGGQYAPNGQGRIVDGGYVLNGSWNFGSGTGHADFIGAGFIVMDGDGPRLAPDGLPEMLVGFLPRREVTFTDGWHVQGLKGTGSYDYNAADVFVPTHRTVPLFTREPRRGNSTAGRMGLMPATAAAHAAWALGVSKSMLDDVTELAATKYRMSDFGESLASRPTFQKGLTRHTAACHAAKLLVLDAFEEAEKSINVAGELSLQSRASVRSAAVYATDIARECAEWVHLAAGTSAIREGSRLERAFRDIYTGTQHAYISERVAIDCGQVQLGIIDTHPAL